MCVLAYQLSIMREHDLAGFGPARRRAVPDNPRRLAVMTYAGMVNLKEFEGFRRVAFLRKSCCKVWRRPWQPKYRLPGGDSRPRALSSRVSAAHASHDCVRRAHVRSAREGRGWHLRGAVQGRHSIIRCCFLVLPLQACYSCPPPRLERACGGEYGNMPKRLAPRSGLSVLSEPSHRGDHDWTFPTPPLFPKRLAAIPVAEKGGCTYYHSCSSTPCKNFLF